MSTQIDIAVLTVEEAAALIEELKRDNPAAICPAPETLAELEAAGLCWDFERGGVESPTIRVPIVGTVGADGAITWATFREAGAK
jgi:hypothetical protein